MIANVVARRYARALLELGVETGELERLTRELRSAGQTYDANAELRAALDNPTVSYAQKRAVLEEVATALNLGTTARHTIFLLADRRRLKFLPSIAEALAELSDARHGLVHAEVTAARPLNDEFYNKVKVDLERLTGRTVVLRRREDPELIAGVVVRLGDTVYDGSLKTRLNSLTQSLMPN